MLAVVHDPVERDQFLEEDIQTILYDFELRTGASGAYWFSQYMVDECKKIQKLIGIKAEAGRRSAQKRKEERERHKTMETEAA